MEVVAVTLPHAVILDRLDTVAEEIGKLDTQFRAAITELKGLTAQVEELLAVARSRSDTAESIANRIQALQDERAALLKLHGIWISR